VIGEILAYIIRIAAQVATTYNVVTAIANAVNAVHNLLFPPGPQLDFQTEQTQVASIQAHILDPTYGLQALQALIVANQTALLAAIANIPVTGAPVTLPSSIPPGWVTPIGDACWGWPVPATLNPAYTFLQHAGDAAIQRGETPTEDATPYCDALWKVAGVWGFDSVSDPNPNSTYTLDVTTILASDATSIDWLNRVYPTIPWLTDLQNGCKCIFDLVGANWVWFVDLPIEKFLALKQSLGLSAAASPAPIWPGLANVTLGSSTPLSNGLVITAAMDGVIVAITSAPPGKAKYLYGSVTAYQHIGALSFEDDNSDQEAFQPLEFESQVYCPKTMVSAAGVRFKVDPAVTGTVTPWTVN
jgi:hypothetical protein